MGIGHGEKREAHLTFIRQLPCCVCGDQAEAAHIRMNDAERGKVQAVGQKPDDRFTVPLCPDCHRSGLGAQHSMNERAFWERHRINPLRLAELLFTVSPDLEQGERIARQARRLAPILGEW
jgi:hypothetical protein